MRVRSWFWPLLFLGACTRVVDIDAPQGARKLVVEARLERLLRFAARQQSIKLSTTDSYFSGSEPPAAHGAVVRVTDDLGRVTTFTEGVTAGTYLAPVTFVVARGRTYALAIDFAGEHYAASDSTREVPDIASFYFDNAHPGRFSGVGGYRATIDFQDPPNVRNYYLWEQFDNGVRLLGPDSTFKSVIVASDQLTDGLFVTGFQPYEGVEIFPNDVVLIRQIALSAEAYQFYFALNDQVSADGSPFAVPAASVRGNIRNTTNASRPALGYFYVSEVAERTNTLRLTPGSVR